MRTKNKLIFLFLFFLCLGLFLFLYPFAFNSEMLNPKGLIGLKERHLIAVSLYLMLLVVVPVLLLTFFISLRYREQNLKAKYMPDWCHNTMAEVVWWGFPFFIIAILSVVTWYSTHELDPFRPLEGDKKSLKIQVVALQWKWLFIYPEQQIASVNFFQIPENTPISFAVTADAPMNSFWIPQLGGQIYAMPGMDSKLHLIANAVGEYRGSSANLSGEGFAGMTFIAKASTQSDFDKWVEKVKKEGKPLDESAYQQLAKPSEDNQVEFYSLKDGGLYQQIVMKYMMPKEQNKVAHE